MEFLAAWCDDVSLWRSFYPHVKRLATVRDAMDWLADRAVARRPLSTGQIVSPQAPLDPLRACVFRPLPRSRLRRAQPGQERQRGDHRDRAEGGRVPDLRRDRRGHQRADDSAQVTHHLEAREERAPVGGARPPAAGDR